MDNYAYLVMGSFRRGRIIEDRRYEQRLELIDGPKEAQLVFEQWQREEGCVFVYVCKVEKVSRYVAD